MVDVCCGFISTTLELGELGYGESAGGTKSVTLIKDPIITLVDEFDELFASEFIDEEDTAKRKNVTSGSW